MLREGSEIALFMYGMMAVGQSHFDLLMGSLIGVVAGGLLGGLVYAGLIRISTKYFFRVTSGLLIALVAGMMLQGVGFLTSAGYFDSMSQTMWDSSWLISEQGIVGQSLKALIGYTAQPSLIQLIVYSITLGALIMLINVPGKTTLRCATAVVVVMGAAFVLLPRDAHATQKVTSPYVERGELELEYRGGYDIDDDSDVDGAWKQKVGVGYGVNDFWFTEVAAEIKQAGTSSANTDIAEIEWENKFQFTNAGEYWLDAGLKTELIYNTSGGADKAKAILLLAKDTGQFSHIANFGVDQEFGEDSSNDATYNTSVSSRYRYSKVFEPGIEMHSKFGTLNDGASFNEQDHRVGPVVYGKIGKIKYDIGYLFGATSAAPDGSVKAIIEYEIKF